jgi:DNA-directed RNA polymerase specialized sigma24 family protein
MTLNQQLKDYEDAVLQKRLEELSPEELAKIQAEIEEENGNG